MPRFDLHVLGNSFESTLHKRLIYFDVAYSTRSSVANQMNDGDNVGHKQSYDYCSGAITLNWSELR